jgi:hypothetical protein
LSQARTGKEMQMVKKFSTTDLQFLKGLAVISPYTVYFSCPSAHPSQQKNIRQKNMPTGIYLCNDIHSIKLSAKVASWQCGVPTGYFSSST